MNKHSLRAISIIILCALLGGSALANVKTNKVRFNEDVTVDGTLVKKGDYKVTFDDQSKELTIRSGNKIVVKTTASLEAIKSQNRFTPAYKTKVAKEGSAPLLTSVYLGGANAVIGGTSADAPAATAQ